MAGPLSGPGRAPAEQRGVADEDRRLAGILRASRTIAVIGASADPLRPSHGVMAYLQRQGYALFPVNPGAGVAAILGAPVARSLAELAPPIDLVAVFRRPEAVAEVAADVIAQRSRLAIRTLWMQLGIRNAAAARLAEASGVTVVMDRCLAIEHARLLRDGGEH